MSQTYAEFKTFLTTFLWRENDTIIANNLDKLIRMANSELNRKLDIQRREVSTTIAPETEDFTLPTDFQQLISLSNLQPDRQTRSGEMKLTTRSSIVEMRERTDSFYVEPFYYVQKAATQNTLSLVGPFSAANPGSFDLQYRTGIPDYQTDDASWLEEDYLDLYAYTVLSHSAVFVREDERMQLWLGMKADALNSALDEDKRLVRFGGSPLQGKPNRTVPQRRRH